MHKRIMLAFTLLMGIAGNLYTYSQTTIDLNRNSIRVGDVVDKYRVSTVNIWDLSNSEKCSNMQSESYEDFKTDTLTRLFHSTRKYFTYHSDSLFYAGAENPQIVDTAYIPEITYIYPMSLGDKYSGFFASHITYCDKMKFHKYGTYTVHADSIGTLVLPNGTSISNALQICHKREFRYDQLCTDSLNTPITYSNNEIIQKLIVHDSIYTEIEKEIYVYGYRYPVVTDFALYNAKNEQCLRDTYFYPLEEQENIPLDEPNMEARRNPSCRDEKADILEKRDISSFVRNNIDTKEIAFDCKDYLSAYPSGSALQCRMLLSDSMGIVYQARDFSSASNSKISMSYSGLRRGQYVLSLIINKEISTINFIIE